MFKTIIWATDGSETADGALPFAKALAACDSGQLVVVHSNELLVGKAGGYPLLADEDDLEAKIRDHLEAKIRDQVDELKAEGFDVSLKLVTGVATDCAHLIADAAREAAADVIVVGTRGHAPVAGVLVGSLTQRLVTQRLLHIAPCPVMAVPTAKQREQREPEPRARRHGTLTRAAARSPAASSGLRKTRRGFADLALARLFPHAKVKRTESQEDRKEMP